MLISLLRHLLYLQSAPNFGKTWPLLMCTFSLRCNAVQCILLVMLRLLWFAFHRIAEHHPDNKGASKYGIANAHLQMQIQNKCQPGSQLFFIVRGVYKSLNDAKMFYWGKKEGDCKWWKFGLKENWELGEVKSIPDRKKVHVLSENFK